MDFVKWKLALVCVFVLCLALSQGQTTNDDNLVVNITSGPIRGVLLVSRAASTTSIRAFKGIPYANPPVNQSRFLAPARVANWTEVKNLTEGDPAPCPQASSFLHKNLPAYSEDCLFINVYAPKGTNSSSMLPVMVWIYGGGFRSGHSDSSLYGGEYLVEQNVIFVSFNYRVGALGFLNLGTDSVPGNAGLKDQLLALQWVQTEISKFGGDPAKVTLFGESAGAASVILHYLSPKSANLFSYAIAESGNALADWSFMETGFLEAGSQFYTSLNCTGNATAVLNCLQTAPVANIVNFQNLTNFIPSLEKTSDGAFLNDTPSNLLKILLTSSGTKRPLLTGINKDEGISFLTNGTLDVYTNIYSNLQTFIPEAYRKQKTEAQIQNDVAAIKTEYFNNTVPSLANLEGFVKIYTDSMFGLSTASFARQLAAAGNIFLYQFEFFGDFIFPYTAATEFNISNGVRHLDELGYIFWRSDVNQTKTNETSTSMITLRRVVQMWTNFAKYGNPTPNTTTSVLGNFTWTPIKNGSYPYVRIANQLSMSTDNFKEEAVNFWNQIESTSFGTKISCSITLVAAVIAFRWLL